MDSYVILRRSVFVLIVTIQISLFLIAAESAFAVDYFIATNGSDAALGNIASPFRTIDKALPIVKAGDVVHFRQGRYPPIRIGNLNGAAGAPITFKAYAGESVTFELRGGE